MKENGMKTFEAISFNYVDKRIFDAPTPPPNPAPPFQSQFLSQFHKTTSQCRQIIESSNHSLAYSNRTIRSQNRGQNPGATFLNSRPEKKTLSFLLPWVRLLKQKSNQVKAYHCFLSPRHSLRLPVSASPRLTPSSLRPSHRWRGARRRIIASSSLLPRPAVMVTSLRLR
jgi:hypothetical protein